MHPRRSIELSIQLDLEAEPIAGRLRQGAGSARPFHGWLGLASAIEDALIAGRQRPDSAGGRASEIEITRPGDAITASPNEEDT